MSSTWTLTEAMTNTLRGPRIGNMRAPSLWPSDASAQIINELGEEQHVGSCRRSVFFRYLVSNYFFNPERYKHYEELVDQLTSQEEVPDKYMLWIWEAGNLYEDYVIEMAKRTGVWAASQVQVVIPQFNLVGKLDLIVKDPTDNKLIAQEVKSIYGHNSNSIIGTPGMVAKKQLGKPRDSNLMQIAIYDWWLKRSIRDLKASRLLYGARDTGRFAEFEVETVYNSNTETTEIHYWGVSPYRTGKIISPITIDSILSNYEYIQAYFDENMIPPRDYDARYSDEKIDKLNKQGALSKTNSEAWEKIVARRKENEERIANGQAPKKELKPLEMGDFYCGSCTFRKFCYDENGWPRNDTP